MYFTSIILALAFAAQTVDVQEVAPEVVGVWKLELADVEQEHQNKLVIVGRVHDELVAWHLGKKGLKACTNVHIKNETLYLTATPNEEDKSQKAKLQATLDKEDVCSGTIEFDGSTVDFTGKRLKAEKLGQIHEWKLAFTTPDGVQRTPTVKAVEHDEKLYGWYSSENYEIPVKKLTNNGDQIVMEIETQSPDGEDIKVVFEGTLQGDQVTGEAKWELAYDSGTFEFTAQEKK